MKPYTKKIVLENGREFYGYGFGADRETINEIVFNTSMVGYQEIVSDPSYTDQTVVMTYPLIGNYGTAEEDYETKFPTIGGMIVREYNDIPSNFRYTRTLNEVFEEMGIPGVWGIDTRALTRIIRDEGSQKVMIADAATPHDEAMARLAAYELPHDMVARVSCKKRWFSRTPNHRFDVVAVDCGIKYNIIRCLNAKGCNVTVVPYDASVEEILAFRPDGIFLSNGPGDPVDVEPVIEKVRALKGRLPIFGICMGHLRRADLQDEVRPPRRQPPRQAAGDGQDRDHEPEPQLCRGHRFAERHAPAADPRQPAGQHGRRGRVPRGDGLLGAVPSRERAGTAGQRLSVRQVH